MEFTERLDFEVTIVFRDPMNPSGLAVRKETLDVWCKEGEVPRKKAEEVLAKRNEELRKEGRGHEAHFGVLYQ